MGDQVAPETDVGGLSRGLLGYPCGRSGLERNCGTPVPDDGRRPNVIGLPGLSLF
jgi:hypothetical protein